MKHSKALYRLEHVKKSSYMVLYNKQLLPGLLVDSADYHPEKELFPEGNARGK